jgi:hypothetical protein
MQIELMFLHVTSVCWITLVQHRAPATLYTLIVFTSFLIDFIFGTSLILGICTRQNTIQNSHFWWRILFTNTTNIQVFFYPNHRRRKVNDYHVNQIWKLSCFSKTSKCVTNYVISFPSGARIWTPDLWTIDLNFHGRWGWRDQIQTTF